MSNLFEQPKIEKPPLPPSRDVAREMADTRDSMNKRKGRAAQIIYGAKARTVGVASSALGG
jgi:hypothetical protein